MNDKASEASSRSLRAQKRVQQFYNNIVSKGLKIPSGCGIIDFIDECHDADHKDDVETKIGRQIKFGDVVGLQHRNTKAFLQSHKKNYSSGSRQQELTGRPDWHKNSWFKVCATHYMYSLSDINKKLTTMNTKRLSRRTTNQVGAA